MKQLSPFDFARRTLGKLCECLEFYDSAIATRSRELSTVITALESGCQHQVPGSDPMTFADVIDQVRSLGGLLEHQGSPLWLYAEAAADSLTQAESGFLFSQISVQHSSPTPL